jgi:hypothetical protein
MGVPVGGARPAGVSRSVPSAIATPDVAGRASYLRLCFARAYFLWACFSQLTRFFFGSFLQTRRALASFCACVNGLGLSLGLKAFDGVEDCGEPIPGEPPELEEFGGTLGDGSGSPPSGRAREEVVVNVWSGPITAGASHRTPSSPFSDSAASTR